MTEHDRKALGAVQTVGMVALVEAVDAMLKAADVTVKEFHPVG